MALISSRHKNFVDSVSKMVYANPFESYRVELDRKALGTKFIPTPTVYNFEEERLGEHPNFEMIDKRLEPFVESMQRKLTSGFQATEWELNRYMELSIYLLYRRYRIDFDQTIAIATQKSDSQPVEFWQSFLRDYNHYLKIPGLKMPYLSESGHIFACFFQIRRAFKHIFNYIIGMSQPIIKLRAEVWKSIFTHDMLRYIQILYSRMGDIPTLIMGASGTGKELIARAVGFSRYIPFDVTRERFTDNFARSFRPVNLSAFAPSLIESELFGHTKGAFTGATADRKGWFEECMATGTVFLDEIGDLDTAIQVKMLRLLQNRTFQRLGDTTDRTFHGKIVAATNRDLGAAMDSGQIRNDFYYRLCADVITTPSLYEQLEDDPNDLHTLIASVVTQVVGDGNDGLTKNVETWIDKHLGRNYPWPGNIRELEQCVRNVMIRGEYRPLQFSAKDRLRPTLTACAEQKMTANELLCHYCIAAYLRYGTFKKAADVLKLDWRTVKEKVVSNSPFGKKCREPLMHSTHQTVPAKTP